MKKGKKVKIGVVGLGTAGITFISELKRMRVDAEIIAFEKRGKNVFHPCSIPEAIEGKISVQRLIDLFPFQDVEVKGEVKRIIPESKVVEYGDDGKAEEFDFIFIGTGGETPVFGSSKVVKATKYEDAKLIREKLEKGEVKKVVVVGAGILGLEISSAIAKSNIPKKPEIEIVELGESVLPGFLKEKLAEIVLNRAKEYGVKFRFGIKVENPEDLDGVLVIVCVGFKPKSPLPFPMRVNPKMQVIDGEGKVIEGLFASGDCIEEIVKDDFQMKVKVPRVAPIAAEQARVSARNIKNIIDGIPPSEEYEEIIAPCLVKAFDLEIGKTGVVQKPKETKEFYLPIKVLPFEDEKLHTFLEVTEEGQILEVEGVCSLRSEVRHLLDISYICMKKKIKVDEMRRFEFSYQPEVCKFPDPITSIAEVISRRLKIV